MKPEFGTSVRRIVTGRHADGKGTVLIDDEPSRVIRFNQIPGRMIATLWATEGVPRFPVDGQDPTEALPFMPGPGGTRLRIVRLPPDAEVASGLTNGFDPEAAHAELRERIPVEWEEPTNGRPTGMHATETVDYICVLSGELWMELDDGVKIRLKPGDCVVQNGTRHSWHNRGSEPCVFVAVMIGAQA